MIEDTFEGRILSIKMLETPATMPIFARKMQSRITTQTERLYDEYTRGGRIHSESLISAVANSAIGYTSDNTREIHMPGGYRESRFRVVIEFLESTMGGGENISYITGYTDFFDYTDGRGGLDFDRNMRFYFNDVRTLAVRHSNNIRNQPYRTVRDNAQILSNIDDDRNDGGGFERKSTHLMTPGIITQLMQADKVHEQLGVHRDEIIIHDSRSSTRMNNNHRTRADNRVPTNFLNRIMDGYSKSRYSELHAGHDHMRTLGKAVKLSGDGPLNHSKIFETLNSNTDYSDDGYVTWGDLRRNFPEVDGDDCNIDVHQLGRDRLRTMISDEYVTPWNDASLETVIANIVVSGIPPMMPDLLFEEIGFTITNETRSGEVVVTIDRWASLYDDLDLKNEIETLEYRIKDYLFNGCPWVESLQFLVTGDISLRFESTVSVSVDQDQENIYRFANYADALATPLITDNQDDSYAIANDLKKLINIIDDTFDEMQFSAATEPARRSDRSPNSRDDIQPTARRRAEKQTRHLI